MIKLDIPHRSQRENDVRNDCALANVAMLAGVQIGDVLRYVPAEQRGKPIPLYSAHPDRVDFYDLLRAFELPFEYARLDVTAVRGWLTRRFPVILLFGYSSLGQYRQMDWRGDHYALAAGYTDEALLLHDPLGIGGSGAYVAVPDAVMQAAMDNMDWPGNTARQALVIKRPYPPLETPATAAMQLAAALAETERLQRRLAQIDATLADCLGAK